MAIKGNQAINQDTEQGVLNNSVDPDFKVLVVENVRRNTAETALEFYHPATEEKQNDTLFRYKLARLPVPGDTLTYLGYLDKDGNWYIIEIDETNGTQKYVKGSSGFTTAWSSRAAQAYEEFNQVF